MKKNNINKTTLLTLLLTVFMLTSCMPGGGNNSPDDPAGFFMGIWHGWIAPISLIWSLFNHAIQIYEPNNTGFYYDLGYYISIIAGFGSLKFIRRKRKNRD